MAHADVYERFHELSIRALIKDEDALEFILARGFTEESIVSNRYGYCDESVMDKLVKEFGKEELIDSRLWMLNEEKGYDFAYFSNRIIIPWMHYGRYATFQGRALAEDAKKRYLFLPGHEPNLYHAEDIAKTGRVWLTEGAFKRDRIAQEGGHAVGLPAANIFRKFLDQLSLCDDLWIVLDADAAKEDGRQPGQDAALAIAKELPKCTVVTLPIPDDADKIGVDDFIEEYGYEALGNIRYTTYLNGVETKPTSLSILVSDWKAKVESRDKLGFQTGYERFDSTLEGIHPGSLTFIAGAPHMSKTSFLEELAVRLYSRNPDLFVGYYSNDDSLFTTITRWVAKLGKLQQKDCRYPTIAFAEDSESMMRFEAAARRLSLMSDRLQILDRSYNISLEKLKFDLVAWRKENPKGEKTIFIDAFTKTKTNRDGEFRDEMAAGVYKSSLLKDIAQEADIPVVVTMEVPKLGGKRPNSWNLRGSGTLEYDADVMHMVYQEAHVKGMNGTDLKIEYEDTGEKNPIIEIITVKDKMTGKPRTTFLYELDKAQSRFNELDDEDYNRMIVKVRESERSEWKN